MKTRSMITIVFLVLSAAAGSFAGGEKASEQKNALRNADAIYNEIMLSLPPEMKARIDSSRSSQKAGRAETTNADSAKRALDLQEKAREQKARYLEELPLELRQQVEKAMQEMEQRQKERELEFKEMKQGH